MANSLRWLNVFLCDAWQHAGDATNVFNLRLRINRFRDFLRKPYAFRIGFTLHGLDPYKTPHVRLEIVDPSRLDEFKQPIVIWSEAVDQVEGFDGALTGTFDVICVFGRAGTFHLVVTAQGDAFSPYPLEVRELEG